MTPILNRLPKCVGKSARNIGLVASLVVGDTTAAHSGCDSCFAGVRFVSFSHASRVLGPGFTGKVADGASWKKHARTEGDGVKTIENHLKCFKHRLWSTVHCQMLLCFSISPAGGMRRIFGSGRRQQLQLLQQVEPAQVRKVSRNEGVCLARIGVSKLMVV